MEMFQICEQFLIRWFLLSLWYSKRHFFLSHIAWMHQEMHVGLASCSILKIDRPPTWLGQFPQSMFQTQKLSVKSGIISLMVFLSFIIITVWQSCHTAIAVALSQHSENINMTTIWNKLYVQNHSCR